MKKMLETLAVLVAAAAALTACKKELTESLDMPQAVSFSVEEVDPMMDGEDPETRAVFGTASGTSYPVRWTANVFSTVVGEWSSSYKASSFNIVPTSNGQTAKLDGKAWDLSGARSIYFYFMSGSQAGASYSHASKTLSFRIPTEQTPLDGSPDETAMILGAKTSTYTTAPTTVRFSPKHLTAYILLTPTNIGGIGTVQSVTVTATKPLSGKVSLNVSATTPALASDSSGSSNSVTAKTNKTSKIWLACLPAQVAGTKLTITVTGSSKTLTREITVPSGKNLTAGKIASLTVDMDPVVHVTGVSLNETTLTLPKGVGQNLTATVTPSDAADKTVTWSSSNTSVATVSSSGFVKGVNPGTATITVRTNDGGKTATCSVTVGNPRPTKVEILLKNSTDFPAYDEGAYHLAYSSIIDVPYRITYSDGSVKTSSGGKLTVVSGSGIQVVVNNRIKCSAVATTNKIRIADEEYTSYYDEMTVQTWAVPTAITFTQTNGRKGGVQEGTSVTLTATVTPSTARQKLFLNGQMGSGWTVTRKSDLSFTVTAPTINGTTVSQYTNRKLTLTFADGTYYQTNISQQFTPSNLDLSKPQPLDYLCYSSSQDWYRVVDGGLRVLFRSAHMVKDYYAEQIPLTLPLGGYACRAIVAFAQGDGLSLTAGFVSPGQLNKIYGPTGGALKENVIHGFAISTDNTTTAEMAWSLSNDNVDGSSYWSKEQTTTNNGYSYTAIESSLNDLNGYGLMIAGVEYNNNMDNNHMIVPVNSVKNYNSRTVTYGVRAWPKTRPSFEFSLKGWFVPTVYAFQFISNSSGKFYGTSFVSDLNWRIAQSTGTSVFPTASQKYWTINTTNSDKSKACYVDGNGRGSQAKNGRALVRPFQIF